MDYLQRIILQILLVLIILILFYIKSDEPQISEKTTISLNLVILLPVVHFTYLAILIFLINPNFNISYYVSIGVSTLIFLVIPIFYLFKHGWTWRDLGLIRNIQNRPIAIISITGYLIFGVLRYFLLAPVDFSALMLVIYFFTNAFFEELLYRGIFLSALEGHIVGNRLLLIQTLVFTTIHIPANLSIYFSNGDEIALILAFTFQFLHGLIFGLVYLKTRSVWISIILHYLSNWMGAWLFLIF